MLPMEHSRHFIEVLGTRANVQFEDMNAKSMKRPYKKHIQRIDEMDRMLRFLLDELAQVDVHVVTGRGDDFLIQHPYKLDNVEAELKKLTDLFAKFKQNNADLINQHNAAIQEQYVMHTTSESLSRYARHSASSLSDDFELTVSQSLIDREEGQLGARVFDAMFTNMTGVILREDQQSFGRMLFRATRGNAFTHFQEIPQLLKDPKTGKSVNKTVFAVYFMDTRSGRGSVLSQKIQKICQSFNADTYEAPPNKEAADRRFAFLKQEVHEKEKALGCFEQFLASEAQALIKPQRHGGNSTIEEWRLFCQREKALYAVLNQFEGDTVRSANCWYPTAEEEGIRELLHRHSTNQQVSAMLVPDKNRFNTKNAPTFIRRNAFTEPFQELVDTYGIPRYGEANPALFMTVTFPFLFGVMYGDVGHGAMLLGVGLFTVLRADRVQAIAPEVHKARYMLCMMGFFALYAGLLYNDFFSLGLNLFGSRWKQEAAGKTKLVELKPTFDSKNNGSAGPYPFGIDPAWHGATNELLYLNSLKMKVSVLLGVAQMLLGLTLRFLNAMHTLNLIDFLFECLPSLAFMLSFFGYMDYMILYKWVTPMDNPPSIINSLICMAMGQKDKAPLYPGAVEFSQFLFQITLLSVPMLLIPKPLILWMKDRAARKTQHRDHLRLNDDDAEPEEFFDLGEVVIHQIIETIEYVLGTVSHTASYLRLWALSLAHQQLSKVFFEKTIVGGMLMGFPFNVVGIFIGFAVWFGITVGVLLGMDVLECFLHTLRLHWVEFQSKFYKGDGFLFEPFHCSLARVPLEASSVQRDSKGRELTEMSDMAG